MRGLDLEKERSVVFKMTSEDRLAAYKLDLTERRRNWRNASFWAVVFSALFILARPNLFWIAAAPASYIAAGLVFWHAYLPHRARRESSKVDVSERDITLTFGPDGLRLRTARDDVTIPFGRCYFWRTNAAITLVYIGANRSVRIPERLRMTGFAMEELKESLWQALGAPGYKRIHESRDQRSNILKAFD